MQKYKPTNLIAKTVFFKVKLLLIFFKLFYSQTLTFRLTMVFHITDHKQIVWSLFECLKKPSIFLSFVLPTQWSKHSIPSTPPLDQSFCEFKINFPLRFSIRLLRHPFVVVLTFQFSYPAEPTPSKIPLIYSYLLVFLDSTSWNIFYNNAQNSRIETNN